MPTTDISLEAAAAELELIRVEAAKRSNAKDPVRWAEHRLGDQVWSKQKEALWSLRDNRRTAIQSCHEIGKSYIASVAVGWWLDTNPVGEAFVVTSAPSGPQVKAILWREIGRVHARGRLPGRVNQTEWFMTSVKGNEELVAFGRKPDDYDPTAFQGIHARRVLYVFDEACGIPASLWDAADSLIANDFSKALVIGNPDDPLTEFCNICKPGSGWNVIAVGAFDSPNFTGEDIRLDIREQLIGKTYVEERRRKWAPTWFWVDKQKQPVEVTDVEKMPKQAVAVVPPAGADAQDTHPFWQSKVLGLFPRLNQENGLIPLAWIQRAQQLTLPEGRPHELSLDVGGGGDDSTCGERKGGHFRIRWSNRDPDTMRTTGLALKTLEETGAESIKVDMIGIGRGVVDRLKELKKPVIGIDVGKAPFDKLENKNEQKSKDDEEGFVNLRSQLWWYTREEFEKGNIDIDPDDEELAAELIEIRYFRTSHGKIQVESKRDAKARGVPSPNRADALMLAIARAKLAQSKATWGRKSKGRG